PTITDTHMAAGCAGGCGGKSPSYRPQAGCNGQKPATTQNYPRSNPQIAENDIFGRETDRYTPSNGSNSTNPNARNGYENKTQSYPKQPSHSCGGSGCHAKQNVQRGSAQGQNQSANPANQPSQRSVADNPSYPS